MRPEDTSFQVLPQTMANMQSGSRDGGQKAKAKAKIQRGKRASGARKAWVALVAAPLLLLRRSCFGPPE
jgi:hypothetical protein